MLRRPPRLHRGSVLPTIPTKRRDGQTVLTATRTSWKEVAVLLFLVAGVAANARFALMDTLDLTDRMESAFSCVGALLGAIALRFEYKRRSPLRAASLRFRSWPIRLDEEITVQLRASLRKRAEISQVLAKVACCEEVTNLRTFKNAIRYEAEAPPSSQDIQGSHVTAEWTFRIPAYEPPSLVVPLNAMRWRFLITIIKTDGDDVLADFELLVVPEVAP